MWYRRIPVRTIVKRSVQAFLATQGITLLALAVVDWNRKRHRGIANFPRIPSRSVTAGGSEVTVYTYGEELYGDMLDAIRQAKRRVLFETFIWKADEIGQSFKQALIDAADRGVGVYVIFDEFANLVVPRSFFHFPAKVHVLRYPLFGGGFRFLHPRYSGRDHRKLMVVDDDVAFVGGYNIGSLYATDWRDTHARLTGDIVSEMQNAFVDFWNMSAPRAKELPDPRRRTWTPDIRVHRNIPRQFVYPIRGVYLDAIDRASRHVWLTHAYLIPDEDMLRTLIRAAKRGVDVRIIVPAQSNHIVADWLSRGFYGTLLRGRVRLFLYQNAMVHAKTATIDGQWSTIGTANIDRLSLTGNYEINIEVYNQDVARELEDVFAVDAGNCIELHLHDWRRRNLMVKFAETVLTPLRPLL